MLAMQWAEWGVYILTVRLAVWVAAVSVLRLAVWMSGMLAVQLAGWMAEKPPGPPRGRHSCWRLGRLIGWRSCRRRSRPLCRLPGRLRGRHLAVFSAPARCAADVGVGPAVFFSPLCGRLRGGWLGGWVGCWLGC